MEGTDGAAAMAATHTMCSLCLLPQAQEYLVMLQALISGTAECVTSDCNSLAGTSAQDDKRSNARGAASVLVSTATMHGRQRGYPIRFAVILRLDRACHDLHTQFSRGSGTIYHDIRTDAVEICLFAPPGRPW